MGQQDPPGGGLEGVVDPIGLAEDPADVFGVDPVGVEDGAADQQPDEDGGLGQRAQLDEIRPEGPEHRLAGQVRLGQADDAQAEAVARRPGILLDQPGQHQRAQEPVGGRGGEA